MKNNVIPFSGKGQHEGDEGELSRKTLTLQELIDFLGVGEKDHRKLFIPEGGEGIRLQSKQSLDAFLIELYLDRLPELTSQERDPYIHEIIDDLKGTVPDEDFLNITETPKDDLDKLILLYREGRMYWEKYRFIYERRSRIREEWEREKNIRTPVENASLHFGQMFSHLRIVKSIRDRASTETVEEIGITPLINGAVPFDYDSLPEYRHLKKSRLKHEEFIVIVLANFSWDTTRHFVHDIIKIFTLFYLQKKKLEGDLEHAYKGNNEYYYVKQKLGEMKTQLWYTFQALSIYNLGYIFRNPKWASDPFVKKYLEGLLIIVKYELMVLLEEIGKWSWFVKTRDETKDVFLKKLVKMKIIDVQFEFLKSLIVVT